MSFPKARLLSIFILLAVAVVLPMRWVDSHLKTDEPACHFLGFAVDSPVLCFEFAWTAEKASEMLDDWGNKLHFLTFGFGLDFLFLLLYPIVLFLVLQLVAKYAPHEWLKRFATFFAPVALISGLFDAVENICLLRYIFGHHDEWLLKTAGIFAGIKFGLLVIGGLIILPGLPKLFKVSWQKFTQWISKNIHHL